MLREQDPTIPDAVLEVCVLWRVRDIGAAAEDGDSASTCGERAFMCRGVDAPREARHDEDASRWITAAATVAGVEDAAASAFVREIAHRAGAVFAERGITTSAELIKRGRKESGLEEDGSYALIGALLGLSP